MKSIFEEAGFTKAESKVYLSTLELGKTASGPIVNKSGLQPSVVFLALHSLAQKGLITTVTVGKRKQYSAVEPTIILELLEQRKKQFAKELPKLLARQKKEQKDSAELFEGVGGIQNLFAVMTADVKTGEVFYYFDAEEHDYLDKARLVYLPFHTRMKEKGALIRGIQKVASKTKEDYGTHVQLRYTGTAIPPDTSIFRDKLALISWTEKPTGILITSPQLAQQYLKLWNEIWEKSKE